MSALEVITRCDQNSRACGLCSSRKGATSATLDSIVSGCFDFGLSSPVLVRASDCWLVSRQMELDCL